MRRLTDEDFHILSVVAKHERVCIGVPVDAEWAPIASKLRQLAKWKYLVEEETDDGPAYSLTAEVQDRLRE
jgi:hypothetical protein